MTITVTISDNETTNTATFALAGTGNDLPGPFVRRYDDGGEAGVYCNVVCALAEPESYLQPLAVQPVYPAAAHDRYCSTCSKRVA